MEKLYKVFFKRPITEMEVIQSGALEPYPDGKIHLDWPVTRGATARILFRMMSPQKEWPSWPRFFNDVGVDSPYYPLLAVIGGVFPPTDENRFAPDVLVTPEEVESIIGKLGKRFPGKMEIGEAPAVPLPGEETKVIPGKHYDGSMQFENLSRAPAASDSAGIQSETRKINRLLGFVPTDQMAPQENFDLRGAVDGVKEIESSLDSFEVTVDELVGWDHSGKGEIRQARDGLKTILSVVAPLLEKLTFSQDQLATAILVDSESLKLRADLKPRISLGISRLKRLKETIEIGLTKLPKEEEGK